MSEVTITITVKGGDGGTSGGTVGGATAPPPAATYLQFGGPATAGTAATDLDAPPLDSMAGGDSATGIAAAADADGPPPLELRQLGMSGDATDRAAILGDMSPPIDVDKFRAASADAGEDEGAPGDVGTPDQ